LTGRIESVFIALIGVLMMGAQSELIEFSNRALMHSSLFYRAFAVPFPAQLAVVRRISRRRWACTTAAAVYTALSLAQEWVLPLFHAEQRLGPVYQRVPYMVPLGFPFLVIVPAVLIDLLWPRIEGWSPWKQGPVMGMVVLGGIVAAQWPFADFLISPVSGNRVFGTHYQMYMIPPNGLGMRNEFFDWDRSSMEFGRGMAIALATAMITSRVGLAVGNAFRRVQR